MIKHLSKRGVSRCSNTWLLDSDGDAHISNAVEHGVRGVWVVWVWVWVSFLSSLYII